MPHPTMSAAVNSPDGFLLFDASMNPIFVNHIAAQILVYPGSAKDHGDLLSDKIRSTLLLTESSNPTVLVSRFTSGKRLYFCRAFRVSSTADRQLLPSLAVILERGSERSKPLTDLSQRFRLTAREQDVLRCLLEGLTSKEIGTRMGISPNTVKAFLRLIMVKMGVSTRSGIIGKAYSTDAMVQPRQSSEESHASYG